LGASVLDTVRTTSPCAASWDTMAGGESARFCAECRQNVYDFSKMTRAQAEALIVENEGRLCARYFRRPDGRIVTRDCAPKILSRKPYWLAALVAFLAMVVLVILRFLGTEAADSRGVLRRFEPFRTVMEWIDPSAPVLVMGEICLPPPPPGPPANQEKPGD